jgi:hypothetical protein
MPYHFHFVSEKVFKDKHMHDIAVETGPLGDRSAAMAGLGMKAY